MQKIELHTEALRRLFNDGTQITCQVLHHSVTSGYRVAILNSSHKHRPNIPVVLAVTILNVKRWPADFHKIDKKLQAGALLGETFKTHGFTVQQNRLLNVHLTPHNRLIANLFRLKPGARIVVECYEFWANHHKYGVVIEFKSPKYVPRIKRSWLGTHDILHHLGISRRTFHMWLIAEPTHPKDLCRIFIARLHGIVKSMYLFFHSQRIIDNYLSDVVD